MNHGEILKELAASKGLSNSDLVKLTGKAKGSVSMDLNSETLSQLKLVEYCEAIGVDHLEHFPEQFPYLVDKRQKEIVNEEFEAYKKKVDELGKEVEKLKKKK